MSPFDSYPFQFLTFVMSVEAIFLSLFILMSSNHSNRQAERRAQLDLKINLLAERESTMALTMLSALCDAHHVCIADQKELSLLLKRAEPKEMLARLTQTIPEL